MMTKMDPITEFYSVDKPLAVHTLKVTFSKNVFRYLLQFLKVQILTKLNSKPEETSKLFQLYCLAFVAYYGFARCSRIIKRLGT